jgi:hypothetical protein
MELTVTPHPIGEALGAAFRVFLLAGVVALPLGLAVAAVAFRRRRQGFPPALRLPVLLVVLVYGLNLALLLVSGVALGVEAVSSGALPAALSFMAVLLALNLAGGVFWVYVLRRVRPDEPIRLGLDRS